MLLLDTGGVFLKKPEDASNDALLELTAGAMIEGLGLIGYDALNLGRNDLQLRTELLRQLAAKATFPLLSANVVDTAGSSPFTARVVKEMGALRVGIFGLAGDQRLGGAELPGRDLKARDPIAAARESVAELRPGAALVIVLSQLGIEDDVRLAREVPGIDIILGGFSRMTTPTPRIEGSTLILHAGAKGMQLGRLGLEIAPGGTVGWTARAAVRGGEARVYDWNIVPLDTALPDHSALAALVERHREQLRSLHVAEQAATPPPAPVRPAYVGAATCGVCHPVQLRQWASSRHAGAFAALKRKRQELNPECVRCHVTGFGDGGGYVPGAARSADLESVQCEACHGFGREHRGPGKIRGRVSEAVCRRCHTVENSPTFKYEPYLRQLGQHTARYFSRKLSPVPDGRGR